jgi:dTDP-4-amino-4,6-dideoxygalactose transaminase
MAAPDITEEEIEAVVSVLRTPVLSIGPRLCEFESAMADYVGAKFAAGVSSGTAGLHLCMVAAGVGPGDCVVTSPFSFVASANCILYQGAIPLFADIDRRTLNLDPAAVEQAIRGLRERSSGARVKAILPVHIFGQPADMDAICDIARRYDLLVIEDACEAIGAEYRGRQVGAIGDAGVFAFYPNKQMTTGEGGMITTQRSEWQALFESLRNQGRDEFDTWLVHSRLGYNYRLDEVRAALGVVQLKRLDELLARRARVADCYTTRLRGLAGVQVPVVARSTTRMSWFVYVVRLDPGIDRDAVIRQLETRAVASRPYFSPIHLQPFYRDRFGFTPGDFPETEAAGRSCLALPFSGQLTEAQVDEVCGALAEALAECRSAPSAKMALGT